MIEIVIGLLTIVLIAGVIIGGFILLGKIGKLIFQFDDIGSNAVMLVVLCILIGCVIMMSYTIGEEVAALLYGG